MKTLSICIFVLLSIVSLKAQLEPESSEITISGPMFVCIGTAHDYELVGYGQYSYFWQVTGGDNEVVPEEPQRRRATVYWGDTPGEYLVKVYYYDDNVALLPVTVLSPPEPPIILTETLTENCSGLVEGGQITTCISNQLTLHVNHMEGYNYHWWAEPTEGLVFESGQETAEVVLSFTEIGVVTLCVEVSAGEGCTATNCITIEVQPNVSAEFETIGHEFEEEVTLCQGDRLFFTHTGEIPGRFKRYIWTLRDHTTGEVLAKDVNTGPQWNRIFHAVGTYEVCLVIETGCSCFSEPYCILVTVDEGCRPPVICPSVVCAGAVDEYCIDDSWICTNILWNAIGGTILSSPTDAPCVTIMWNDELQDGYGILELQVADCNPMACETLCPGTQRIIVPVIPTEMSIAGPSHICDGSSYEFSVPQYPGATYIWNYDILSGDVEVIEFGSIPKNTFRIIMINNDGVVNISCEIRHAITGCISYGEKIVEYQRYTLSGNQTHCMGSGPVTYTISPALSGMSFSWNLLRGAEIIQQGQETGNTFDMPTNGLAPGNYQMLILIDGTSCELRRFLSLKEEAPDALIIGPGLVCEDLENLTYLAIPESGGAFPPSVTFTWNVWPPSSSNKINSSNGSQVNVTWKESGFLRLVTRVDNICPNETLINIEVTETPPIMTIVGEEQPCPGAIYEYEFNPYAGTTPVWRIEPALAGEILGGWGSNRVQIRWNRPPHGESLEASLHATVQWCDETTLAIGPLDITVEDASVTISTDEACEGNEQDFFLSPGEGIVQYICWTGDGHHLTGTDDRITHTYAAPGSYPMRVEVAYENGCMAFGAETITVHVAPSGFVLVHGTAPCPMTPEQEEHLAITLTPVLSGGPFDTYDWYHIVENDEVWKSDDPQWLIESYEDLGHYYLDVVNEDGCATRIYVKADYDCGPIPPQPCSCDTLEASLPLSIDFIDYLGCGEYEIEGSMTPSLYNAPPLYVAYRGWLFEDEQGDMAPEVITEELEYFQERSWGRAGMYSVVLEAFYGCHADSTQVIYDCYKRDLERVTVPLVVDVSAQVICDGDEYLVNIRDMTTILSVIGGTIDERRWTLDNVEQQAWANEHLIQERFEPSENPALHTVCLQVKGTNLPDGDEECEKCVNFTIPALRDVTIMTDGACTDYPVGLSFSIDGLSAEDIIYREWIILQDESPLVASNASNPAFTFDEANTYTVRLRVFTLDGCMYTGEHPLVIMENDVAGMLEVDYDGVCNLTATITFIPDDSEWDHDLEWQDGQTINPIIVSEAGVYSVTVTGQTSGCQLSFNTPAMPMTPLRGGISGPTGICVNYQAVYSFNRIQGYGYTLETDYDPAPNLFQNGSFNFYPQSAGTYYFRIIATKGTTACDTAQIEVLVRPLPDDPILEATYLQCEPFKVEITSDIEETRWLPSYIGVGDVVTVYNGGNYKAYYFDEHGCGSPIADIDILDKVDFGSFLTGCYKFCDTAIANGSVVLMGIPGVFSEWKWLRLDANGQPDFNTPLLEGNDSEITDLVVPAEGSIDIVLYVKQSYPGDPEDLECSAISDPICIIEIRCGCDEESLEYSCTDPMSIFLRYEGGKYKYLIKVMVELQNDLYRLCQQYFTLNEGSFEDVKIYREEQDGAWFLTITGVYLTDDPELDEVCILMDLCDDEEVRVDCPIQCCLPLTLGDTTSCNLHAEGEWNCQWIQCGEASVDEYTVSMDPVAVSGKVTPAGTYLLKARIIHPESGCIFDSGFDYTSEFFITDQDGKFNVNLEELTCHNINFLKGSNAVVIEFSIYDESGLGGPLCKVIKELIIYPEDCIHGESLVGREYMLTYACDSTTAGNFIYNLNIFLLDMSNIQSVQSSSILGTYDVIAVDSNHIAARYVVDSTNRWLHLTFDAVSTSLDTQSYCINRYLRVCGFDYNPIIPFVEDQEADIRSQVLHDHRFPGELHVFPNPAEGIVTVRWQLGTYRPDKRYSLSMRDMMGREVHHRPIDGTIGQVQQPLAVMPSGIYIVVLSEDGAIITTSLLGVK